MTIVPKAGQAQGRGGAYLGIDLGLMMEPQMSWCMGVTTLEESQLLLGILEQGRRG